MKRKVWLSLVALIVVTVPLLALAQGLVPCTGAVGDECQFCRLVQLIDNVVTWLVGVLSVIAAIMIAYGGFLLVTSAGNTGQKEKAKTLVTNTIIGFVIVLAAWLLIDLFMQVLIGGQINGQIWNQVQCVAQPVAQQNSQGLAGGGTVAPQTCDPSLPASDPTSCAALIAACQAGGGTSNQTQTSPTQGTVGCTFPSGGGGGSCQVLSSGPCSVSNLQQYFGSNASVASQICNKESGGQPVRSGSDLCCGSSGNCSGAPSFSGGYFQINILANARLIPGCNMQSIFNSNCLPGQPCQTEGTCVRRNGNGICTGWSCTIQVGTMYNTCMQGALNPATNFAAAQTLSNGGTNWGPWRNSANLCSIP